MENICNVVVSVIIVVIILGLICLAFIVVVVPRIKDKVYPPCVNCKHYVGRGDCDMVVDEVYGTPNPCYIARDKLRCKFESKPRESRPRDCSKVIDSVYGLQEVCLVSRDNLSCKPESNEREAYLSSLWAKCKKGEDLPIEDRIMFNYKLDTPKTICFNHICISNKIEKLMFANGTVFVKEHKED